jgi:hypothetical protein
MLFFYPLFHPGLEELVHSLVYHLSMCSVACAIKIFIIVNDIPTVINEQPKNLECHSIVVNYISRGVIHSHLLCLYYRHHLWWLSIDNRNMFIVQATSLECKPFLSGAEIRNSLLAEPENSGIYCPRIKLTHVSLLPFIYINLGSSL